MQSFTITQWIIIAVSMVSIGAVIHAVMFAKDGKDMEIYEEASNEASTKKGSSTTS